MEVTTITLKSFVHWRSFPSNAKAGQWGPGHVQAIASCTSNAAMVAAQEKKVVEFTAWLQAMGHDQCNLRLHTFPPGAATPGFGTIAGPGGVQKGQVVAQVPLQAFMSEETALACPHVGPLIKRAEMTPWQGMCLHLLFERAKGHKSMWHPYIALLPTELEMVERHPLMWPQGLCQEWLAGSPMLSKMEGRFAQCKEDYKAIVVAGASALVPFTSGSNSFITETSVRWAASILLSRAFSLDLNKQDDNLWSDESHSTVLVPWADMLNHSSSAGKESCLEYDCSKRVACLSAHTIYEEGEQVFDSYGPNLSPSQLLLDYGFVDDKNQNHSVDLPATVLGPIRSKTNKALLTAIGLPPDGAVFSITESGVDESVLAWTRVAIASTKELANAGWNVGAALDGWACSKAASSMAYFHQPVSQENESEVLRRLLSACGTVLTQYPTSLDNDLASLATNSKIEEKVQCLPWARIQAQRAIISEKKALRAAWKRLYILSKRLQKGVHIGMLYKRNRKGTRQT